MSKRFLYSDNKWLITLPFRDNCHRYEGEVGRPKFSQLTSASR